MSGACTRNVLNEAAKVPLIPVPGVGVQPRYATQCDFGSHGDSFESNGSEQTADRRVSIAGPNRDKDIVAFIGVQMPFAARASAQAKLASCPSCSTSQPLTIRWAAASESGTFAVMRRYKRFRNFHHL